MKKLVSLLLLGMSGLSVAGTYDFSRLENMSLYDVVVKNNLGDLIISEVERQNGRINAKYRAEIVKNVRESFSDSSEWGEMINFCKNEKEKCSSIKSKEFMGPGAFDLIRNLFEKMECAAQDNMEFLYEKPANFLNKYENMAMAQLSKLPKNEWGYDLEIAIAQKYGRGASMQIMYLLPYTTMCASNMTAKQRQKLRCDMKLKDVLKQL